MTSMSAPLGSSRAVLPRLHLKQVVLTEEPQELMETWGSWVPGARAWGLQTPQR